MSFDIQPALQHKVESLDLANNPTWHKLLLYETSLFSRSGFESAIHSEDFFNASTGRFDPDKELLATLQAIIAPVGTDSNQHAQCRFRARYLWLKDVLAIEEGKIPEVNCPNFNDWSMNGETESVSIIFATGFLDNPASYYGHTFFKLNAKNAERITNLLDVSVNYGAIVPRDDSTASFIVKSLTGNYDAGFSYIHYYFHTHNYGETEFRDMWEYELNLSQKDLDLVIAHAWEVLGKKYTYFFFEKNCAYRIGELLEIIDEVDIIPDNNIWVLPQMLIKKMGLAQYESQPLVRRVVYYPSRQSRLYQKYERLEDQQRHLMKAVVHDITLLNNSDFRSQPLASKHQILDTLLDYYQFISLTDILPKEKANESYRMVLARRYRLPPGIEDRDPVIPIAPHLARDSSLTQVGVLNNADRGSGISLTIRPTYYDALDASHGHIKNAELIMGELQLVSFDGDINIRRLNLLGIQSVRSMVTGLPGDDNRSWKLQFGWESQNLACTHDCLVVRLQADSGYTWMLGDHVLIGGYLGGAIQDNRNDQGNVYAKGTGFAMIDWGRNLKSHLEYEYRQHMDGDLGGEDTFKFTTRYHPDRENNSWDIRLSYEHNRGEELSTSFGYYW